MLPLVLLGLSRTLVEAVGAIDSSDSSSVRNSYGYFWTFELGRRKCSEEFTATEREATKTKRVRILSDTCFGPE